MRRFRDAAKAAWNYRGHRRENLSRLFFCLSAHRDLYPPLEHRIVLHANLSARNVTGAGRRARERERERVREREKENEKNEGKHFNKRINTLLVKASADKKAAGHCRTSDYSGPARKEVGHTKVCHAETARNSVPYSPNENATFCHFKVWPF